MPSVAVKIPSLPAIKRLEGYHRHDIVNFLEGHKNVGIELGVAEGIFSSRMISSGKFQKFFAVDVYGDIHNTPQYKRALLRAGLMSSYSLLRMRFDEAFDLFPDGFFDFIYIDGYAHNGEEGGKTIVDWYRKLKTGGLMAGDDYHEDWPLVVWAVNDFVCQSGENLMVTELTEPGLDYCKYPSWCFIKTKSQTDISPSAELLLVAKRENERKLADQARKRRKKMFRSFFRKSSGE